MSWDFRGASFDRSAVGPHARVYNAAAPQLRARLADLRAELESTAAGPTRSEAVRLLDELDHAVAQPEPDREVVRSRWRRLSDLALAALPTGANLAQIAGLVNDLVGG